MTTEEVLVLLADKFRDIEEKEARRMDARDRELGITHYTDALGRKVTYCTDDHGQRITRQEEN